MAKQQQAAGWGFFRLLGLLLIVALFVFLYTQGPQILASGGSSDWRGSVQSASRSLRAGIQSDMTRARAEARVRAKDAQIVKRIPACSALAAAGDSVDMTQIHVDNILTSAGGLKCHN